MPVSAAAAAASAARSSSLFARVFGRRDTINSSEAPIADAAAEAEPPPGVGSADASAAISSRTVLSTSIDHDPPILDDLAYRRPAHAQQIDRRTAEHDDVHLL